MKKRFIAIASLIVFQLSANAQNNILNQLFNSISTQSLKANLYFLAGDKCQGRMVGSHGDSVATDFVETWMKKYNLMTGVGNSFRQQVAFTENADDIDELELSGKKMNRYDFWDYTRRVDIFNKELIINNAPLVFINYGLAEKKYNDYSNVDIKGKVVVLIRDINNKFLKDSLLYAADLKNYKTEYEKKGA